MPDELEERLAQHAEAFNGLLSLIPAKMYFGEDVSDQWRKKKQTKEEKRAAKRAKLDMDNYKSAKDVMDERAKAAIASNATNGKRTRVQTQDSDEERADQEMSRDGLTQKKIKANPSDDRLNQSGEKPKRKDEAEAAMTEKQQEPVEKLTKKKARQPVRKWDATANLHTTHARTESDIEDRDENAADGTDNTDAATTIVLQGEQKHQGSSTASSPEPPSPTFDTPRSPALHSASSSISSIQPPTELIIPSQNSKSKISTLADTTLLDPMNGNSGKTNGAAQPDSLSTDSNSSPSENTKPSAQELQQRLAARIAALRTARKADGLNGQPARSRQELLESRRRKEEERRAHKRDLRRQAKEEEARIRAEEMARRFSPGGSGSLLASPMSPVPPEASFNNFSFGRVAFGDGSQLDQRQTKKQRGPSDPATALQAAQAKHDRTAGLDAEKKATIAEKDMWANANSRARGEKIRDDTNLLKKTLKRQESKKSRSEKEWKERSEGIQKAGEARQRKREENLRKRKEDKRAGKGKKSKGKGSTSKSKGNVIKRPGFEGTFRGRTGGGGGKKNNSNI